MLRRLFGLGCACAAVAPARALSCRAAACSELSPRAERRARADFDALAHAVAALAPAERIPFANVAINRLVVFADDAELGAVDVWQTPLETFARGRGDCEDIAIAKFFLLLAAGTDAAELRLLYARRRDAARPGHVAPHVVALARHPRHPRHPLGDPLVLDNVDPALLPLSQRGDLEAVFSFDRTRLWAGVDGPCHGRAPERLRPWRELLGRVVVQHSSFQFPEELVDDSGIY